MRLDRRVLFWLATSNRWEKTLRTLPGGERGARQMASRYVAGDSAADAFRVARELEEQGVGTSIDCFGELVTDHVTADEVTKTYLTLADQIQAAGRDVWLALDLTHLGLDIDQQACTERLVRIAEKLPGGRRLQVGAEDFDRADSVLECVLAAVREGHADRLSATIQANFHRSQGDMEKLIDAGVHVRLVKGAYVEPPRRALPYGEPTDVAYVRLAHRLAEAGADFALATHDGLVREALLAALGPRPVEQLLGVTPDNLPELTSRGVPVRVYVPYGQDWFRYWMRRLAESRGA